MKNSNLNWFNKQALQFEEARFAAMTILLTVQSCLGSVAAMFILKNDGYISLSICAAVTMGSNAAFIAQSPAKWCLGFFYVSVITNALLIILNLL